MGEQGREVLTLIRRSARRREYELRRGGAVVRVAGAPALCLLGGFMAVRELQGEVVDASAAVGGIVAG